MDDDRSRFDSLGVSHSVPGQGSRRIFWILGGAGVLLFLAGIFYTIFFYMTLPNHHALLEAGQKGVNQVPLPVPPTTLFPENNPSRPSVMELRTSRFSADIVSVRRTAAGLDVTLRLMFDKGTDPISLVLSSPPRWVDGKQGASVGSVSWDQNRMFTPGESIDFPIHFPVLPRTSSFDLYISFTGGKGNTGDRYVMHFINLKSGAAGA
ncbi:hypothetical protein [Leptospirillum ferriphilum]|uniref:hypothetical protein n=1 Tax=Leptospirillum ferriphilum TaxID=178606 RepID=UPI0006B16B47|nr:hypothetical protein [Leptospirillum ferriphilum]